MAQLVLRLSSKFWFRSQHVRVRKVAGHGRLQLLRRVDLCGHKGDGGVQSKTAPTAISLTHVCRGVPVRGVKLSAEPAVNRQFTCPRAHGFCVAPAPVQHCNAARAVLGYCDHGLRANLLGVSVACEGVRTGPFGSRTDCLLATEYGQASSWCNRVGLLPRSSTQRTATLDGVSGPPVVTSLVLKIGLVSAKWPGQEK